MCLPFVVLSLKTISHLCPCSAVSPASPLLNFHVALRLLEHPSRKQVPLIIAMCCNCRITELFYMGKKKAPLKKISWEWIISEALQRELLCFSKGRREAGSCIWRFHGLSYLLWHPDMRTVKTTHTAGLKVFMSVLHHFQNKKIRMSPDEWLYTRLNHDRLLYYWHFPSISFMLCIRHCCCFVGILNRRTWSLWT